MKKTLILLSITAFLSSITSTIWAQKAYLAIADAGSTGTRLYVYSYETEHQNQIKKINLNQVFQKKIGPGLSVYANTPSEAGKNLIPLVNEGAEAIKKAGGDPSKTHLSIFATAGMRLVEDKKAQAIYQGLRKNLSTSPFIIDSIRTIPGYQEGIYAWVGLNFLENKLDTNNPDGMLELGGASTQITFPSTTASPNTYQFNLGNQVYRLFSMSFLSLGENAAFAKLNNYGDASLCYPKRYPMTNTIGQFNDNLCSNLIEKEFVDYHIPQQMIPPSSNLHFVGLSGYYYTFDFFKASSLQDLNTKQAQLCNKTYWDDMKKLYPTVEDSYLSQYCFNANLINKLLTSTLAYQFNPYSLNFTPKNDINGYELTWTRGVAIYQLLGKGLDT